MNHSDYKLEWQRKWRANNPEKAKEIGRKCAKARRENKPEEVKASKCKDYLKHREAYLERSRLWRLANRERFLEQMRKFTKQKQDYINSFKDKPRCTGCECIVSINKKVCEWCIMTYPHKYQHI